MKNMKNRSVPFLAFCFLAVNTPVLAEGEKRQVVQTYQMQTQQDTFKYPKAVLATKDPFLVTFWKDMSEFDEQNKFSSFVSTKVNPLIERMDDHRHEYMGHSHIFYILEAKMDQTFKSSVFASTYLAEKRLGLYFFRGGAIDFFKVHNYADAREDFAAGIVCSGNLTPNYVYSKLGTSIVQGTNQKEYCRNLGKYFVEASTAEKERIMGLIDTNALTSEQELDFYWNLGAYLSTNFKMREDLPFIRSQLQGNYKELSEKFVYKTFSSLIFDFKKN